MLQVEIGYAYPSSPNAKYYGFNDTGCYTVYILPTEFYNLTKLSGHATLNEAVTAANATGYEFSPHSLGI